MTCKACTFAETEPTSAFYVAGCRSCEARVFAATGAPSLPREQYRDAVRAMFGEHAQAGHDLVKQWAAKIRRAAAAQGSAR